MSIDALAPRLNQRLPRLAWIAVVDHRLGQVRIEHGDLVEVGETYVVEGVWDAPFRKMGFHNADHFFGTGLHLEGGSLFAVPSCALVDRLLMAQAESVTLLSNSLPLLLGHLGASLAERVDYRSATYTVLKGIDHYESLIPVEHPQVSNVRQIYYDAVRIDANGQHRLPRKDIRRFRSYHEYIGAVEKVLSALLGNARHPGRMHPLKPYCTTSAGYDSPAVTAMLAGTEGLVTYTSRRSNSLFPAWVKQEAAIDDGTRIAERLGVEARTLRYPSDLGEEEELAFLAPSAAEPELIFANLARDVRTERHGGVVFSGYHGDKVWDVNVEDRYVNEQIMRGDPSGLALGETRLRAGFVHVAVPFIYVRSIADIRMIGRSEEMADWRLGSDYDRPIPRRVVESRGVPRSAFGQHKKAVTRYYNFPTNPALRRMFMSRIRQGTGWTTTRVHIKDTLDKVVYPVAAAIERLLRPFRGQPVDTPSSWAWDEVIDLPYELHIWALGELSRRYRAFLEAPMPAPVDRTASAPVGTSTRST